MLAKLLEITKTEGIEVIYWDFPQPIEATYCSPSEIPPTIGLSNSLLNKPSGYVNCVLAELLGVHFLLRGNCVIPYIIQSEKSQELDITIQAKQWAALQLIPQDKLLGEHKKGVISECSLAKHFDVTEEMVKFRLNWLSLNSIETVEVS